VRFEPPMAPSETHKRRALIAELAFSLFVESIAQPQGEIGIENRAWAATELRLAPYVKQGLNLNREFSSDERREIDEVARSLSKFFEVPKHTVIARPVFKGCGFVDASEGDVIRDKTIFEIKTVERPFRSSDIRQAIAYAALNFSSEQFQIQKIGLFNPRRGLYCDIDIDEVCAEISGRDSHDLLALIVQSMSSEGMSR
jgi:hypothetical protein